MNLPIEWLAPGGLITLLLSMLAYNARTLFRRDQQVWDLIEEYKQQVTERDETIARRDETIRLRNEEVELWRDKYYNLLVHGQHDSLASEIKPPQTGDS